MQTIENDTDEDGETFLRRPIVPEEDRQWLFPPRDRQTDTGDPDHPMSYVWSATVVGPANPH
jgi:hypothetical protein